MTEANDGVPASAGEREDSTRNPVVSGEDFIHATELGLSPTEQRNSRTENIDKLSSQAILELINDEDERVAAAVRRALGPLSVLVDRAVEAIRDGGRVHYFGAGTSGRIGMLDAAEIPPTYGVPSDRFVAHLAGGTSAFLAATEAAEDDDARGAAVARAAVVPGDVAIGIASSGRTPYVRGALQAATEIGAFTGLITSNPAAPLAASAKTVVCLDTGPEVITGSTRMKSATAQKMALNAFSTAVMVRTGHTWSNLMSDMRASNSKLRDRAVLMMMQATGADQQRCVEVLIASDGEVKTGLVALLAGAGPGQARAVLGESGENVSAALALLGREEHDPDAAGIER